jgi:hypothetical protein
LLSHLAGKVQPVALREQKRFLLPRRRRRVCGRRVREVGGEGVTKREVRLWGGGPDPHLELEEPFCDF